MVNISIIIPTYNRNSSANACIRSLLATGLQGMEIVVVNDYKKGKFVLESDNQSPAVKIYNNPGSGVAAARNTGAAMATASKLIFVDDDMIVNKEAITKAVYFLDMHPNSTYNADWIYEKALLDEISATAFGRYLIRYNFTSLRGWNNGIIEWKENSLLRSDGITSQFFAIKKSDFGLIGGYNEAYPLAGFEDYEIRINMQKNNIAHYIDTSVMIYHNERDRVTPSSWLERKKRGAYTRRIAVERGFNELAIVYHPAKKAIYKLLSLMKPLLMGGLKIIPDARAFDGLYFKMINLLLGINIFEGYHPAITPPGN